MTKRQSSQKISEIDDEEKRKLRNIDSEPVKVEKTGKPDKSDLAYFIKDERVLNVLNEKGIKKFFPVQYETFEFIYQGEDVIARDRTGSGKTIAFALPIIERFRKQKIFRDNHFCKYLIVLPTRELAIQVKTEINSLKIKKEDDFDVVAVYGGSDIHEQIRKIREGCDIIVATPGRLIDLLERGAIKLSHLMVTCLDEADEMLKQGFQQDIQKIFEFIQKHAPSKTQNLLFSATIPSWVVDLSKKYLSPDRQFIDLIKDTGMRTSKTVEHMALNCPYYHRNAIIADIVNLYGGRHGRTIIFCQTKKEANEILLKANLKQQTQVLHGDIPQKQRQITFQTFKQGKLKCMVATNVAARGLDIPEVDLIVQLEPPKEIDAYIHRSGRTGRAGKSGVCVTFYTRQQQGLIERIQRMAKIKMKKIGPPQPVDIIRSSARDIVISLKEVSDQVIEYFADISQEMIKEEGAVKALSKALAFISGNTKKISQRSILCSIEGFITYIVKCPCEYQSPGFIFSFLKKNTFDQLAESVKGMRRLSKNSAVFDVPEDYKDEMDELIRKTKEGVAGVKGYEVILCTSMDMLEDDEEQKMDEENSEDDQNDDKLINDAMRNKRDFEIFIGSLPPNADERELKEYFKSKKVKVANIRILKNQKGESKCVGFALCLTNEAVQKALELDGDRFGSKPIRINKAASGRDNNSGGGRGWGNESRGYGNDNRGYGNDRGHGNESRSFGNEPRGAWHGGNYERRDDYRR